MVIQCTNLEFPRECHISTWTFSLKAPERRILRTGFFSCCEIKARKKPNTHKDIISSSFSILAMTYYVMRPTITNNDRQFLLLFTKFCWEGVADKSTIVSKLHNKFSLYEVLLSLILTIIKGCTYVCSLTTQKALSSENTLLQTTSSSSCENSFSIYYIKRQFEKGLYCKPLFHTTHYYLCNFSWFPHLKVQLR